VVISVTSISNIIIVEKHIMQFYLEQNFHKKHQCIIVNGCGMPGHATRDLLKLLKDKT